MTLRMARLGALVLSLLAVVEAGLWCASLARGAMTFDVGPSTGAYLAGFTESEERPPTTLRWARNRARIALPLQARAGAAELVMRFGRFVDDPVNVQVYVNGELAGSVRARPGRQRVERLPVTLPANAALVLTLASNDPGDLAVALDWVRIEGGRLRPAASAMAPRLLVPGVLLVALLAGWGLRGALSAALTTLAGELAFAAWDPFGCVHVLTRVALPALFFSALFAFLLRTKPRGRFVALAFLLSYLLKGAALFHPSYFYNDVRNNRRYVEALRDDRGGLLERNHNAQVRIGVGYPRIVAGRKYAFPYSPVFFLPFGLLPHDTTAVDEGLKHVVVAFSAAEVLLVFLLAGRVFGPGCGAFGALLAAFLPIQYSRLLLALWSTVGGHVFDVLTLWAALGWAAVPSSRRAFGLTWACVQASFLTYVASLFNMSIFTALAALLVRSLRWHLLAVGVGSAVVTVGALYFDFALLFLREILPGFLSAGAGTDVVAEVSRFDTFVAALGRIPIFYGWLYPPLALWGLWLARRRAEPQVLRMLCAYGLTFVVLVLLRGLGGGLFKDLKEIEFVAPLVALFSGAALENLASRGRSGMTAAALLSAALVAFGVVTSWGYVVTWTALAGLD